MPTSLQKLENEIVTEYFVRDDAEREVRSLEYKLRFHVKRPEALERLGLTPERLQAARTRHAEATKALEALASEHPLWTDWMIDVKGIGPIMVGSLVATWGDLHKLTNLSQMWSSATLGLKDGKPQRRLVRGRPAAGYGPFVKVCWLLRDQLLKARGVYFEEKERFQARYEAREDVTCRECREAGRTIHKLGCKGCEGHARRMAMRAMSKLALAHVWEVGRMAHGLPVNRPYAFDILKHGADGYIGPLRDK